LLLRKEIGADPRSAGTMIRIITPHIKMMRIASRTMNTVSDIKVVGMVGLGK
jgi:hypothetical protein